MSLHPRRYSSITGPCGLCTWGSSRAMVVRELPKKVPRDDEIKRVSLPSADVCRNSVGAHDRNPDPCRAVIIRQV